MNLKDTIERMNDADRIINARHVYLEFSAESDMLQARRFIVNLGWAVFVSVLGYAAIFAILGGFGR